MKYSVNFLALKIYFIQQNLGLFEPLNRKNTSLFLFQLKFNTKKKCLSQGSDCEQSKEIVIFHHSIEIFTNQAIKERGGQSFGARTCRQSLEDYQSYFKQRVMIAFRFRKLFNHDV